MSRLPDLERVLFDAAERIDAQADDARGAALPDLGRDRRWRRRGTPLLAVLVSLAVAGAAVAAVTGLLDSGDPVPPAPNPSPATPAKGTRGFTLAMVRAADPDGGPQWGIGTYDAVPRSRSSGTASSDAAHLGGTVSCVVVGRVQNRQLGVIGRDGVFHDDGRFHPLSPTAQSSGTCAGRAADGAFVAISSGPPIPASGYTGAPGGPLGGCRERVNLDGPTVSPQTRRRLRNVPQCSKRDLRYVIAGFAGPKAVTAMLTAPGYRRSLTLRRADNGAYLFVLRPTTGTRPQLTITDRDGHTCRDALSSPCPNLFP